MRKIFGVVFALMTAVSSMAQTDVKQSLIVNGETVEKTVAKITFDGNNVVLTFSDGTNLSEDMGAVRILFDDVTAVSALQTGKLNARVGDYLNISNLPEGTTVEIFDAQGKSVCSTKESIIKVNNLKPGMYLLKANNQVVKFMKH